MAAHTENGSAGIGPTLRYITEQEQLMKTADFDPENWSTGCATVHKFCANGHNVLSRWLMAHSIALLCARKLPAPLLLVHQRWCDVGR
jgi:hypothetical protein